MIEKLLAKQIIDYLKGTNYFDYLLPANEYFYNLITSQLAWAVEHNNCISAAECLGYEIKQSDDEASALEIWGSWSIPSLPLLPGPLWPGGEAPNRFLSMGQIELTACKQMSVVQLWLLYNNTWNRLTVCQKKRGQAHLRVLSTKCIYKLYICIYIYIYVCVCACVCVCKEDLALNNLQWLICHKTQLNQIIFNMYV